jgi:diaminopimelate epimerase
LAQIVMNIPFTKAHGARNDFLLTWEHAAPLPELQRAAACAICDRHTGVGADGWLLVTPASGPAPARIRLFNPDGSEVEMSGNGTRCAAAFLIEAGHALPDVTIVTGAGPKQLRLVSHQGRQFLFEMNMGAPVVESLAEGPRGATLVNVGNPQCAVFVDNFDFDWPAVGAELERHPVFPKRTNVSFVRVVDAHTIDVRFFERGVGVTMSSGTGSTGAMVAAVSRGLVQSPVTVETPAGPLAFRWEGEDVMMQGPAEITASGEFYFAAQP